MTLGQSSESTGELTEEEDRVRVCLTDRHWCSKERKDRNVNLIMKEMVSWSISESVN